jgi:glutamate racemase
MRIALLNSGLGLLAAAAQLHKLMPGADLVLAMDPDGMPWGARTPTDIAQRSLACARAAAAYQPDVLVFACNTGSVHALGALRAEFEPGIPVVGTVPAIKPAAAASDVIAIWATAATTGSTYQRQLITEFAASARVAEVACPGLADAIHAGDGAATRAAVSSAAARTPADCGAIVLGCTEYELAADLIGDALPGAALFGSGAAVAAQALRRAAALNGAGHDRGTVFARIAPPSCNSAQDSRPGQDTRRDRDSSPGPDSGPSADSGLDSRLGRVLDSSPGSGPGPGSVLDPSPGSSADPVLDPRPGPGPGSSPGSVLDPRPGPGLDPSRGPGPGSSPSSGSSPGRGPGQNSVHIQDHSSTARDPGAGSLYVLLSGRPASLPAAALRYPEGRLLAAMPAGAPPSGTQPSGTRPSHTPRSGTRTSGAPRHVSSSPDSQARSDIQP